MVIDETALLRAIREDYRGQGYTVARRSGSDEDGDEDESVLVLDSSDWLVEIEWKNVSPKIIGLIAQHLKGLPRIGEAFTVQKKETKTTIFNMVDKYPEIDPKAPVIAAHRTRLMYENMEVWQKDGNNGCMFVHVETADMLLDHGRVVKWVQGGLCLEGKASRIRVLHCTCKPMDHQQDAINFLNGKRWW